MRKRPRRILALEPLEQRCTPANFVVNTTADTVDNNPGDGLALDSNGQTSLRAAIQEANALPGEDTISFNLGGGPTRMTPNAIPGGATIGLLLPLDSITSNITILGPGANLLTITHSPKAEQTFRIFTVTGEANALISGLTITGGDGVSGGGIYNDANLEVDECQIIGNQALQYGGGIYNQGNMYVRECSITSNVAGYGGGIANSEEGNLELVSSNEIYANEAWYYGGGIYNAGVLAASDSAAVHNNQAQLRGGGLYASGSQASVTWTGGRIDGNGSFTGGGIYLDCDATFSTVSIRGNDASDKGGGVYLETGMVNFLDCDILANTAGVLGAGICWKFGTATLTGGNCQGIVQD
jgi:CSLREA domain-containing protein